MKMFNFQQTTIMVRKENNNRSNLKDRNNLRKNIYFFSISVFAVIILLSLWAYAKHKVWLFDSEFQGVREILQ